MAKIVVVFRETGDANGVSTILEQIGMLGRSWARPELTHKNKQGEGRPDLD